MTTETNLIVRYAETDQMGIAHHSVYPIWFEAARTDFLKQAGMSYQSMERSGLLMPLALWGRNHRGDDHRENDLCKDRLCI